MFEVQPQLTGKLVHLRPLQAADYDALYQVASDPRIWEQHPDKTRSQRDGFQEFFDKAIKSPGALLAIDIDIANATLIGCTRFHSLHEAESDVTIGYTFLSRAHWGAGFNTEMKHLMLGHAFEYVQTVRFRIAQHNLRSRRAVEKLGAICSGPEAHQEFGQTHILYRIERDHFRGWNR